MKGDFTRSTFKPEKHYSSVRMQQGRVQLDADWNEQMDINSYRIEKEASDIIGPCGVPWNKEGGGFQISANGNNLTISQGSIYVDGILCENPESINIIDQEDLPDFKNFNKLGEGVYLAYLDVWQCHVTAIEDPQIREVALGGPDTATRTKTVWQVKLEKLEKYVNPLEEGGQIDCEVVKDEWDIIKNSAIKKRDIKLAAFTKQETPSNSSCNISPNAGYRRLENQLYRVEIHTGGDPSEAKFKWSRDNGSVVFPIEEFIRDTDKPTNKLKLRHPGRDKTLSLKAGDWIEVLDDATELSENPAGTLVQITENPDASGRIISLSQTISGYDMKRHPRIRRWDQKSDAISVKPPSGSDSIELEDGIYVWFSGDKFRAGDYWLIPARTATENTQETGKIEWPQDESKDPIPMLPEGIVHHYCHLAVLQQDNDKKWKIIGDCRKFFPAVTELTSFFHVCGDGQEAMPGEELAMPLQVGVSNGKWPVSKARVRFQITFGNGTIMGEDSSSKVTGKSNYIEVPTNDAGIASCKWILDKDAQHQQVEATLRDACCYDPINTPIRFNANLSVASEVAYTLPDCAASPVICKVVGTNYQYWSEEQYPVIDLFGEKNVPLLINKTPSWKSHVNKFAKLVLDSKKEYTLKFGKKLQLGQGYILKGIEVDLNGDNVWLELSKEGELVDKTPISIFSGSNETQEALGDILDEDNVVVFRMHLSKVYKDKVKIDGLWLLDYKNPMDLKVGDKFGEFTLDNIINGMDASNPGSLIFERTMNLANGFPTVKELFEQQIPGWPLANTAGNISVKGMLDTFLCDFNAAHLPLDKLDNDLCNILSNAGVITVQDALKVLCGGFGGRGCGVFVNNTKQFQEALDNLEDGSTICLLSGNFNPDYISIQDLNNIVIRGCTLASKLFTWKGIDIRNCNNIVIENLDISGNIFVQDVENFSLKRNNISLADGHIFKVKKCSGAVIESNQFILSNQLISEEIGGLEFCYSKDLKIQKNTIDIPPEVKKTFSGINVKNSSDVEIVDNLIEMPDDGDIINRGPFTGIKIEGEKGYVSVASNRTNVCGPSLILEHNGPVRVHGNFFSSGIKTLGTTDTVDKSSIVKILSKNQIIFTDNHCESNGFGNPVNDLHILLINIESGSTIFSNNSCAFTASFAKDKIKGFIKHVSIDGFANVIGNRCEENITEERIYSISATGEKSIVLGNITTNKIVPEPKLDKLNLHT